MANEFTISFDLSCVKAAAGVSINVSTKDMGLDALSFTMNGEDFFDGTQLITTSTAQLNKGAITAPGLLVMKNIDATNYIEFDKATFTIGNGGFKLKAGEMAFVRVNSSTNAPFFLANTASCRLRYKLFED